MSSWLTALRIARREARRAKGRSALVIAMIALPVFALTFAAASYDMFDLTAEEKATRMMGAADATIHWDSTGPVHQDPAGQGWSSEGEPREDVVTEQQLLAALPAGSRVIPIQNGLVEMRTAAGVGYLDSKGVDVESPLAAGMVKLLDGRAPANDAEVAVTEKAVDRLGTKIGGTVQNADGTKSWTVTGIVEFPDGLNQTVVFRPGAVPTVNDPLYYRWLWDAPEPVNWEQVKRLNLRGMAVFSRAVLLDPPPADQVDPQYQSSSVDAEAVAVGGLIAGLGILEIVLLAGPAFAVGARRRQRDLGLIAANGGTPSHLRRIVLADGVVLGALGAAAGLVLGIGIAFAARPLIEVYLVQARAGGYRVFPLALLGITILAVGTGMLAALVPAFTSARADVVAALTGRRGVVRSRKRWLVAGLVMVGAGTALTMFGAQRADVNVILAGLVVGELGLVLCTPSLVGLIARIGRVLPLAPRIALRDTARNRAAAAPAIAAVMAAVAGSVAIGVYFTADQERNAAEYEEFVPLGHAFVQFELRDGPSWPPTEEQKEPEKPPAMDGIATLARDTLPATETAVVSELVCPPGTADDIYCGLSPRMPKERECPWYDDAGALSRDEQRQATRDPRCKRTGGWYNAGYGNLIATPAAVAALTGASGDDLARARATLEAGGVLISDARYLVDGKVTLEVYDARQQGDSTTTEAERDEMPVIVVPGYATTTGVKFHGPILSAGAVRAANLAAQESSVVIATSRVPTQAEEDRLNAALRERSAQFGSTVERGPDRTSDPTLLVLAGAAGLITLGAAGIATGLAAADGRADLATLAAVGASPGVRRRLSLSQSGVIAGLGSALGILAGLGAGAAVLFAYNQAGADRWPQEAPYPIGVPWQSLAVILVVPVIAMLGAGLFTRSRLPVETRRA